ncbi:hypothetical protein KUTeg_007309 [Tegillarca granosa]|uniref:Fibrinogen C-terminal domain-containing protein n=1 Tax=Tegillarca granosa TaxID=220873 RepID=A0ABQ9FCW0_TEGGR|nr:hypothetical protein KUTeg_007309 [Tegillarca granosa]
MSDITFYLILVSKCHEIKSRDCEDIFQLGNTIDGVYSIYRNGSQYDVYCDMNRHGWTVFQRRFDGSTDFYRDWNSYETGFGNVTGEFWLGLDKIYELTSSATYSLRIEMEDFDGVWKYALYSNFKLGDKSTKYTLNYDTFTGNAGDALDYCKGYRFATYDNDKNNCSMLYSGAWWYRGCHHSNLNGLYNTTIYGKGINWYHWHGYYYSLKTTEMKIRRIDCEDVFKLGNTIDGVYSIYRNGSQYDVYCDMNRHRVCLQMHARKLNNIQEYS